MLCYADSNVFIPLIPTLIPTLIMSRMFEQVKREQLNQASRKAQTSKFELSRLENKREENALMQFRLREESDEIEKHIKIVKEEIIQFIHEREQIATGKKDFEIRAGLLSDIAVRNEGNRQQPPQQMQLQQPLIRSVSAERKRDVTTNPRYACSEFYKNFGSNTHIYLKISANEPKHNAMVDVNKRVIVAEQPIGGKIIFKSFNEWTVAHLAELNKQRDTKTSKSAYNVIWYQDNATGEWNSLMTTAVVGNIIN